jgi:hypothetical protein
MNYFTVKFNWIFKSVKSCLSLNFTGNENNLFGRECGMFFSLKNERQVDGHRLFKVRSLLPGLWQGRDSAHLLHAVVVIAVADDVNRNIPADRLGFLFLAFAWLLLSLPSFIFFSFSENVERRRDLEYPVATGSDVT